VSTWGVHAGCSHRMFACIRHCESHLHKSFELQELHLMRIHGFGMIVDSCDWFAKQNRLVFSSRMILGTSSHDTLLSVSESSSACLCSLVVICFD